MESNNNSRLIDYALQYKNKSFSVIPLQTKSKIPAVESWTPYRTYIANADEISDWFSTSDYNVGIVMGSVSKVFAIDIDDKEAYDYFTNKIEQILDDDLKISIKNTMKIMTGSGNVNFLFKFDPGEFPEGDEIPNTIMWKSPDQKEHCEIRFMGEGKYIVAPPSIHPNNQRYYLVNGINPIFLTRKQIKKIIDLFSQNRDAETLLNIDCIERNNHNCIPEITEILKPYYNNGQRNDFVLSLSGWLRKLGLQFEIAEQIILDLSDNDEEKSNRLITLSETYKKNDIDEIVGYSGLIKLLLFSCTEADAKTKLDKVKQIIVENFGTSLNKKENKKNTKQQTETDLVILVRQNCDELFVDQLNKPHVAIKIKDHAENLPLDSYRFKNWLFALIYKETGNLSSSDMVENIIRVLKSEAEFSENTKTLELRVAKTDDYTFYYDLTDRDWKVVKITAEGWTIERKPPILFKRYSNQTSQTLPFVSNTISQENQSPNLENNSLPMIDNTDDIFSTFLDLLNIKDDDTKLLLKCYIISLFIPGIPKPILMLHGEQGSAKSTCQELIKMLVDPIV
ncbi:MAG: bifunctional DNA primase/polymerase [Nitrososphaeraceae archaeon]